MTGLNHAVVVVLGDSGRSPRMQFHAQSLAELEKIDRVSLIGYSGEKCNDEIRRNDKISDNRLDTSLFSYVEFTRSFSSLLHAVLKGVLLVVALVRMFFSVTRQDNGKDIKNIPISFVIIQNPPATPVALAAVIYRILIKLCALLTRSEYHPFTICIDWHNLGFTLYYDRYEPTHILVRISYYLELLLAKLSDKNLCVSVAMSKWLKNHYGIDCTVFYDRPPKSVFQIFTSDDEGDKLPNSSHDEDTCCGIPLHVRHNLLKRLNLTDEALFPSLIHPPSSLDDAMHVNLSSSSLDDYEEMNDVTLQTYRNPTTGKIQLRNDRAVVLLSSTSWTPDEDFTLLTKALINLDKSIIKRRGSESPRKKQSVISQQSLYVSNMVTRVVVVITGKGPMKEKFMKDWNESQEEGKDTRLQFVTLKTVWLEISDYPLMVACADMGICLHTSSSGVDLPMKVLDMFGAGVPVCAVSFPALPELIQNGGNGIIFRTSSELSAHLFRIFCDFPRDQNSIRDLTKMKKKALSIGCWEDNWADVVKPIVLDSLKLKMYSGFEFPILIVSIVFLVVIVVCGYILRIS